MLALFDRMVDVSAQAVPAALLRTIDHNEIRQQLLESPDATINRVIAEAKTEIRSQGCPEELEDGPMLTLASCGNYHQRKLTGGAWTRISAGRNARSQRASVAGAQRRSAVNPLSTARNTSQ